MNSFENRTINLRPVDPNHYMGMIAPILTDGEQVLWTFQAMRDGIVFTSKRIIAIDVQGMSGKQKEFSSLPYKNIQAFSVQTAGLFDLDSEMDVYFTGGIGRVRFEFKGNVDIKRLCQLIGAYALR